jgi:hypothetical protein
MNEAKKGVRKPIYTVKTKNPVAKAHQAIGTGSGAHKDKKKAAKQGDSKHKKDYAEGLESALLNQLTRLKEDSNDEYNDEAGMSENSLLTIARAASGLLDTIEDGDNLPEWCQEKLSIAEDYLVTVWDYLQSEKGVAEGNPQHSHQYDTTMKHAKNPTVQQRMAAHDIKPGVAGYRDRIDLLKDLERTGKLKKEGWTHDSLADRLFEHERTYEDKLNNQLNKKLGR